MTPIKQRGAVSRPCQEPATYDSREAVLYARVSSKEQELGYSMPAQQELLRSYAAPLSIRIAQEFGDAETAKTTGRPGFAAMVSYLKQRLR